MRDSAHKIGAVFYVLWGILHVFFGGIVLYRLATGGSADALAQIGTAVPTAELGLPFPAIVAGVIGQHAWNLIIFGLFATVIGATMNWRNSRLGYWLNLGVVSGVDLGFICAIVLPGFAKPLEALAGPVLWILGAIFTTIGLRQTRALSA